MNRNHIKQASILLIPVLLLSLTFSASGTIATSPQEPASHQQEMIQESSPKQLSLQETIINAPPGATIQIPPGIYTEILSITKPLHLRGAGATQTFLTPTSRANGYAIHINAPNVTISDLSITNKGPGLYTTAIKITAPNTIVQDCTLHDTPIGIALWSSHNTITRCTFSGCDDEGIVLLGTATTPCTNNTISSCIFIQNCDGIELQHASHNLITHCQFIQNTHAGIDAIKAGNNHNTISHCTFIDNAVFGLYLSGSSHTLITDCYFHGDSITLVNSPNNTLQNSQVARIHLMKHSSLHIQHCTGLTESQIISQQSSYEINTEESTHHKHTTRPHLFYLTLLYTLLSRFRTNRLFSRELPQIRM